MGRSVRKIAARWRGWTREQRVAGVTLPASIFVLAALAIAELFERPADVSNPEVSFEPTERPKSAPAPIKEATNWPRYGYDRARTKYLNAPRIKPPFLRRWNYERGELIEFAPIIVDGTLYGIDNDAVVFALDADTGKELWTRKIGSLNASSPAYSMGRLFAVNLSPPQVVAMRARDGKPIWRKPLPSRAESSPLYHDGRIYFGTESGEFFALRTRDGKTLWKTNLAGAVKAAPAYVGGSLYVGDYAGDMYAIRADDGRIRWRAGSLGGGFGRGGRFYSTPAVAFGRVYAGNVEGRVYSFDRKTGRLAWTHSAGHFVYSGVAAADTNRTDPTAYVGSHDRYLYALDARSGRTRWREPAGGQISGPATVIGNLAYISTFSGNATVGLNLISGDRAFRLGIGQYGPVVSDAVRLYVVGGDSIRAYDPVKNVPKGAKRPEDTRGVLSPKSLSRAQIRRIRRVRTATSKTKEELQTKKKTAKNTKKEGSKQKKGAKKNKSGKRRRQNGGKRQS